MIGRRAPTLALAAIVALVVAEALLWTFVGLIDWTFRNFSFDEGQRQATYDLRSHLAFAGWASAAVHVGTVVWFWIRSSGAPRALLLGIQLADVVVTAYIGVRLGAQQGDWANAALWWSFTLVAVVVAALVVWGRPTAPRSGRTAGA
jgi:hypothetical protein